MKYASLRGNGLEKNEIFNLKSKSNRDNCFQPYAKLREKLLEKNIELNTADLNKNNLVSFELHQDFQSTSDSKTKYLMMFETDFVFPENGVVKNLEGYRKIFTWRDDLIDGDKFIKINFPNPIEVHPLDGFLGRDLPFCLIAGNKNIKFNSPVNLYPKRVEVIRWFEKNHPTEFFLYGNGWALPPKKSGSLGRALNFAWKYVSKVKKLNFFPSYCGPLADKREVLRRARFSFCYENIKDLPGYITEKIFDCFFSGCVPIYWGAENIDDYIPSDCFIDRRRFHSMEELYDFAKSISESEYQAYQNRIARFLKSSAAIQFGSDYFAETIANAVEKDIDL